MPSLSSGLNLGSASSLIRSANSLSKSVNTYNDSLAAYEYELSPKTDADLAKYQDYLNSRIKTLSTGGGVSNAEKSLTLQKTLTTAIHSNVSANIQRENIQVMAGNASLQDKYGVVVKQYQRAISIGDLSLAQQLESQAYSISQSIQYQAQQSANAAGTLGNAASTQQGNIVTNLKDSLEYFKGLAKNASENELNAQMKSFAKSYGPTLNALGVHIATAQPNYFDVVSGIVGAIYNHTVLEAQAGAAYDTSPGQVKTRDLAMQAQNILSGQTTFSTLAGNMTFQEIQQASQDPQMLTYDNATGTYKRTEQQGYKYETFTDPSGKPYQALTPTYTGIVGGIQASKVYFLTPNETKNLTNLGLQFTQADVAKEVANGKQVGAGVSVQLTADSPEWLKQLVGQGNEIKLFTDQSNSGFNGNGFVSFRAGSSTGKGFSYYSLLTDANGRSGVFEHLADGTTQFAAGDFGLNQSDIGAMQMLINQAQSTQRLVSQANVLQAATMGKLVTPHLPTINPQKTASPQPATYNPQRAGSVQNTANPFMLPTTGTLRVAAPTPTPKASVASPTPTPRISSVGNAQTSGTLRVQ